MVPRKHNAYARLTDVKRPYHFLARHTPVPPLSRLSGRQYGYLNTIRQYHAVSRACITYFLRLHAACQGDRGLLGRFRADYMEACTNMERALHKLEVVLYNVCLVPKEGSQPSEWELRVKYNRWASTDTTAWAISMHQLWYEFHVLASDLEAARDPLIQQVGLVDLSLEVLALVSQELSPADVRAMAAVSKSFHAICGPAVYENSKVTVWYQHAYRSDLELQPMLDDLRAPSTPLGNGLACMWAWFRHRDNLATSSAVQRIELVNRWSWARAIYSEMVWAELPRELAAWSTCIYCGLLSLPRLRDVTFEAFPLTAFAFDALARHPTIRGLHLRACGIPLAHERRILPSLHRLRRLTLMWDPASPFEAAAAARLLSLAPNVVHLHVANRFPRGPMPIRVVAAWPCPPFHAMQSLALVGTDGAFAAHVLRHCRSRLLQDLSFAFMELPSVALVHNLLSTLATTASALVSLRLEGCPVLPAASLTVIGQFSFLRDLAIFPRFANQDRTKLIDWSMPLPAVATSLSGLRTLHRFAANFIIQPDAIGPAALYYPDRAQSSAYAQHHDDAMDEGRGCAIVFAAAFPALHDFVIEGSTVVYRAEIVRSARSSGHRIVPLVPGSTFCSRPWWRPM